HLVDLSAAPTGSPAHSAILAEVSKEITAPVSNGFYPVYIDRKRGSNSYCAWHDFGSIHGVQVQFAFFFNLDADSGCTPNDSWTTHSAGLAALANVSGHELSEALSDPQL